MDSWDVAISQTGDPERVMVYVVEAQTPVDALKKATLHTGQYAGQPLTLPQLEQQLLGAIRDDVERRNAEYTPSKQLRDRLLEVLADVFIAGCNAGPIPGAAP